MDEFEDNIQGEYVSIDKLQFMEIAMLAYYDGSHHKDWVVDQLIRQILGMFDYNQFTKAWLVDTGSEWEQGIAP